MTELRLVWFLLVLLPACSDQLEVVCTNIGCSSGLEIAVNPPPMTAFRVEAFAPGFSALYAQDCPDPGNCTSVFLPEFMPDVVNIRVIVGGDTTFVEAASPEYTERWLNGPDCPPTCRVGYVTIAVPAP